MAQPNILEYLPAVWAEILEMRAHAQAQEPELSRLWANREDAYKDQFLFEMTENGIKRWESILHIFPFAEDTLEDRRFRIINRLNAQLPYTYRMLEAKLNTVCGKDGYTMSYTPETWVLRVRVALTRGSQLDEVEKLLKEMIPINIILDYDLQYNSHGIIAQFKHGDMVQYTHGQLRATPFD